MINGIGIVGWGVGGIEAEAGMLGQPVYFLTPDVVGVHLTGALREGVTATDLALTVTQMLRKAKVVGKFVEFFGPGAAALPVVDRATIANMAPEYGATMGFFPIDAECVNYLRATGRSEKHQDLRKLLQGAGLVGHSEEGRHRILAGNRTRSRHRVAERRRPEASAGPHRTAEAEKRIHHAFSASRSPKMALARRPKNCRAKKCLSAGGGEFIRAAAASSRFPTAQCERTNGNGHEHPTPDPIRARAEGKRPRLRAHRRHHELHEHQQSERHARRRFAREEGRGKRPHRQSRREGVARARLARRHRLSQQDRPQPYLDKLGFNPSATAARRASAIPARCIRPSRTRS
jgi:hypothetical protein